MRLVLVDAYDSFTHNLAQAFAVLGADVEVVQCDAIDSRSLADRRPDRLVLGPGPGRPEQAGCFLEVAREWCGRVPILGVCLGHQALCVAFGGTLRRWPPVHGRSSRITHDGSGLFAGLPDGVEMGRYHSLGVDRLPEVLRATAHSDDGVCMGLAHREAEAWGVQFHPESVLSGAHGVALLARFLTGGR